MSGFGLGNSGTDQSEIPSITIEESTPFIAAGDGDLDLLQASIAKLKVPVNAADANGFTFCHAAASYNQIPTLRWLLKQNGVDPNAKDTDGDTPLHHCDQDEAAKVLVEEGSADHTLKNNEGKTPLQAKEEELIELKKQAEEDSDDEEDFESIQDLVKYLKGLEPEQTENDVEMS